VVPDESLTEADKKQDEGGLSKGMEKKERAVARSRL
jgi:hypothetical protein